MTDRHSFTITICVVFILFCPPLLTIASVISGRSCDSLLKGHTDDVPFPVMAGVDLWNGDFQKNYESYLDAHLKPRGVFTKIYNTIRYYAFDLSNDRSRTLKGKENYIFEIDYVMSNLGLGDFDYSSAEKKEEMHSFVDELVRLKSKLSVHGKKLYVYIPGNKAKAYAACVPDKYFDMRDTAVPYSIVDCFRDELEETGIDCFFADDMLNDLKYPSFCKSGTHWSRTYEQEVTNRVIGDLSDLTKRHYRPIIYKGVEESRKPFWRDSDILDLCNIWYKFDETYYQYQTEKEFPENYDKLRIMLQGDSYGLGTRKDILDTYPYEKLYYINYYNYVIDNHGKMKRLNQSWDNLDWQYYLDRTDVIVVEMCQPSLRGYSHGFVQYLNQWLDHYVPGNSVSDDDYMDRFAANEIPWKGDSIGGVYDSEGDFAWAKPYSEIILNNREIAKGIEISFRFPEMLGEFGEKDIHVYVNGYRAMSYTPSIGKNTIRVDENKIPKTEDSIYDIEIYCEASFIPLECGMSNDNRDLAIQLEYVGAVR